MNEIFSKGRKTHKQRNKTDSYQMNECKLMIFLQQRHAVWQTKIIRFPNKI